MRFILKVFNYNARYQIQIPKYLRNVSIEIRQNTFIHRKPENSEMQDVCSKIAKCCTRTLQNLKVYSSKFKIEGVTSKIDDFLTFYRPRQKLLWPE